MKILYTQMQRAMLAQVTPEQAQQQPLGMEPVRPFSLPETGGNSDTGKPSARQVFASICIP